MQIDKNNRMGKTRDHFKKIRYKGICHTKIGKIKVRKIMDLIETENIKKMWQVYTEELYKKGLNDLDNHGSVISHLKSQTSWSEKSSGR